MDVEKGTCFPEQNGQPLEQSYSISLAPTRSRPDQQPTGLNNVLHQDVRGTKIERPVRTGRFWQFWRAVRTQILPPLSLSPSDTASWDEGYSELSSPERQSSLNHSLRGRPKRQASTCSTTTKKGDEPIHVVVVDRNFKDLLGDHAGFTPSGRSSAEMEATTPAAEPPLSVLAAPPLFPTPSNSAVDLHGDVSCRPLRWSERSKHFLCTTVPEAVWHFFDPKFKDPKEERAYRRESWTMSKPQALTSAAFLSIAWIVTVATQARPFSTFVKVGYCAIGATSIAPIMPLVIVNAPRRSPWLWQFPLFVATWALPYVIVFDLWNCHFYIPGENRCPQKDFIGIFYFALAFPTFALFMLHGSRALHAVGVITWVGIVGGLVVPQHIEFIRNLLNCLLFQIAICFASYLKEKSDRKMFILREQLKSQFKATQKAQVAERAASESKKRFVSYIFHEVRVPLNSSLLAYQNLLGENVFDKTTPEQKDMVTGLSSSLFTMEKVLNDLLDFNKMEAGRLTWSNRPFHLHATFRALLLAFRSLAAARNIQLETDFDPDIDAYSPMLLGDSMRLSQIISNLISNASKFTENGKITCVTRLLHPVLNSDTSNHRRGRSDLTTKSMRTDLAIVRIEIRDTGVGIHAHDLTESRLFSPYHQTSAGLTQEGKGSGLGLALVRKIVKLSGGRLGVQSAPGQGSTFWVELPFGRASSTNAFGESRPLSANNQSSNNLGIPPAIQESASISSKESREAAAQDVTRVPADPPAKLPTPNGTSDTSPKDVKPSSSALNILVADDDPLTRRLMTRMLTRLSHKVTLAEDGFQALSIVREAWKEKDEGRFDAILLDNQMPNMTGVECVRELRRIGVRTYVCGITGNALLSDQQEFTAAGADKVLTKPVLERSIRDALVLAKERVEAIQSTSPCSPPSLSSPASPVGQHDSLASRDAC